MRTRLTQRLSRPGLRFTGLNPLSTIALSVLALVAALAIVGPMISGYSAGDPFAPVLEPDGTHWFGTDASGRDIFTRVAQGARASLMIGLAATALALLAAAILGSIAATAPKWVSEPLMRILDVIMSFPGIALAAVFVAVWSSVLPILVVLIISIAFLYVPQLTRVVRANVLSQFGEDYVAAARVSGASTWWVLVRHVARNCAAPILVFATVLVADAIVLEASLSFINAGIRTPDPSWGNILAEGKQVLLIGAWWPTFFPGLMILLTVLSLNVLSEGLTDALVAPKSRPVTLADPAESTEAEPVGTAEVTPSQPSIALSDRLALLREAELARTDRLSYDGDDEPLLEVADLSIAFPAAHGDVDIVDKVSFTVRPGETMGIVGESGSGKSLTSLAIMGLLPATARVSGSVRLRGQELLTLAPAARNALRGHEMSMVYQDALSSLNPSMLIRSQLAQLTRRGGKRTAPDLLELVGLDPVRTLASYPHELSGGQRQRVLIAMALTRNPSLVIADEPTTALDVTVQKQVVDLLNELRAELGFAMVFVSHDLGLVAQLAHRVTVMYAGQVVESGPTTALLTDPRHEYTRGLLGSVLSIEQSGGRLHQVPGVVPSPREFVAGDRFAPRSSTPTVGLDVRPEMVDAQTPGHRYAALGGAR